MTKWDTYGDWNLIARGERVEDIKTLITGSRSGWRANFCSAALAYALTTTAALDQDAAPGPPTVLDFGCGLGRNGAMLKRFFPRLCGVDLPDMVRRLQAEQSSDPAPLYDSLYASTQEAAACEAFCMVYDSVVIQHLVDAAEIAAVLEPLLAQPRLRSFVTMYNSGSSSPGCGQLLLERGWQLWHSETETLSFQGIGHIVDVYRLWDAA